MSSNHLAFGQSIANLVAIPELSDGRLVPLLTLPNSDSVRVLLVRLNCLQAFAVEVSDLELPNVHVVQAACIDGNHGFPIGTRPPREGLYPARSAEKMVDLLLVELIVGQLVFASQEPKLLGGHERE